MKTTIQLLIAATLSTGCVSAKKHDELQAAYSDLLQRNQRLDAELTDEERARRMLDEQNSALANQNDQLADKAGNLAADVERQRRALQELRERQAMAQDRVDAYQDLVSRFADLIDAGTLTVNVVDGRMVVQLPTDILFPSGSAELSKDGRMQLEQVGAVLAGIPRTFQIEGHTDSDPISTERFPSNWELASARATTVLRVMEKAGVPVDRLSTAGFADTRPVASNDDPEGKKQNRRIEIAVVPDLSALPGADALRNAARDGLTAVDE
jgi:chemotaxis protein MotB